jgi:hypothetical protein
MEPPGMGGGGNGGAPDTAGTGGQSDAGVLTDASDATVDAASMASFFQVAAIFADSCSGGGGPPGPLHHNCHSVDPFDGNLDLTVTNAYTSLVNHPSDINPNVIRVIPGDPDNSLLMRKILYQLPDDGGLGDPMPKGEAIMLHLPDEQIQLIRAWILNGAHPN